MLNVVMQGKGEYSKETLVAYNCNENIIRFRTIDNQQGYIKYKSPESAKDVFMKMIKQEAKELQADTDKILNFELLWLPEGE